LNVVNISSFSKFENIILLSIQTNCFLHVSDNNYYPFITIVEAYYTLFKMWWLVSHPVLKMCAM